MTKTSRTLTVVLFLTTLSFVSACSRVKEGNQNKTPPGGDCSNAVDSALVADVKTEFSKKLRNKVPDLIKVDTKAGVVTLTGTLNFDGTRKYAGEIAKGVRCVKDVVNKIEIKPEPGC